jgi:hypothetical protein
LFYIFREDQVLTARDYSALCDLVGTVVQITAKKPHPTISKVIETILHRLEEHIKTHNPFMKGFIEGLQGEISRISLFKALFKQNLDGMKELSADEISLIFHKTFPEELIQDPFIMETFNQIGKRLENAREKYQPVVALMIDTVKQYLQVPFEVALPISNPEGKIEDSEISVNFEEVKKRLKKREEKMNDFVFSLDKNKALRYF